MNIKIVTVIKICDDNLLSELIREGDGDENKSGWDFSTESMI